MIVGAILVVAPSCGRPFFAKGNLDVIMVVSERLSWRLQFKNFEI